MRISRRAFGRGLLSGAALALSPLGAVSRAIATCPAPGAPRNLIVIFTNGGLRSQDFVDVHFNGTQPGTTLSWTTPVERRLGDNIGQWSDANRANSHTEILDANADEKIYKAMGSDRTGDVYCSYNARGLFYSRDRQPRRYLVPNVPGPLRDVMCVVRNVDLETASHPTGKTLALNGRNSTQVPAGPVLVGNLGAVCGDIRSWNMGYPLNNGTLPPSIPGEPADLEDLFTDPGLANSGGGSALDTALVNVWFDHDDRYAALPARGSVFFDARRAHADAQALMKGGIASVFDVNNPLEPNPFRGDATRSDLGPIWEDRFYGAVRGVTRDATPVVTIDMTGFDTHDEDQGPINTDLGYLLGTLLEQLHDAGRLGDTLVVVTGDFDRTPTFNAGKGTDHFPAGPVLLFGGGIQHRCFGHKQNTLTAVPTNLANGDPGDVVITRQHLWATILDIFGVPNPLSYMTSGAIITGIKAT